MDHTVALRCQCFLPHFRVFFIFSVFPSYFFTRKLPSYFFSISFLVFWEFPSYFWQENLLPIFFSVFPFSFLRVFFLFFTRSFPSYFFQCFFPRFLRVFFLFFYNKFPSYFRIFRDVSEIAPCLNANYTCLNRPLGNYFSCRFAYREIIEFLKVYHKKNISLPTVKKKF